MKEKTKKALVALLIVFAMVCLAYELYWVTKHHVIPWVKHKISGPGQSIAPDIDVPAPLLVQMSNCDPNGELILPVRAHNQETGLWCWAASAQMIMEFLKESPNQCKQANDLYDPVARTCCQDPFSKTCMQSGWPDFRKYNFSATPGRQIGQPLSWQALSWDQLTGQICKGRPFAWTVMWEPVVDPNNPDGHMMVVTGYFTDASGEKRIKYINPCLFRTLDQGQKCVAQEWEETYEDYKEKSGFWKHWKDFYDIFPNEGP